GGTLKIGSPAGIVTSGASGNVLTSTETYDVGANFEYKGTAAQATGDAFVAANNLTINNSGGDVTLTSPAIVTGNLALQSGNLVTGASTAILMPMGATSSGTTDVVGTVVRDGFPLTGTFSAGNPNNQITISSGSFSSTQIGTVSNSANATQNAIGVNETATPPAVPFIIQVGTEQMLVTIRTGAANPRTYTVT